VGAWQGGWRPWPQLSCCRCSLSLLLLEYWLCLFLLLLLGYWLCQILQAALQLLLLPPLMQELRVVPRVLLVDPRWVQQRGMLSVNPLPQLPPYLHPTPLLLLLPLLLVAAHHLLPSLLLCCLQLSDCCQALVKWSR
jgi:hypothetical protein